MLKMEIDFWLDIKKSITKIQVHIKDIILIDENIRKENKMPIKF